MANQRHISIEKLLLSLFSVAIIVVSTFCWGQIIVNAPEQQMVQQQNGDTKAVQSFKNHFIIFSGAVVVLARHLSSEDNSN